MKSFVVKTLIASIIFYVFFEIMIGSRLDVVQNYLELGKDGCPLPSTQSGVLAFAIDILIKKINVNQNKVKKININISFIVLVLIRKETLFFYL